MILKGFKENSIKKNLRTLLNRSDNNSKAQIIDSVGVIVNADEVSNFEQFKSLTSSLNISTSNLQIVAFTKVKDNDMLSGQTCFNVSDIGWKGAILNSELATFLDTKFDLLISFYTADLLHLKLLTAKSKAHFKASIFQEDDRLNDLIISTTLNDFDGFKIELLKYLHVFKTLKHEA